MDVMQTGIGAIQASWSFTYVNGRMYYQRLGTNIVEGTIIRGQTESVTEGLVPEATYSLHLVHNTVRVKAADLIYIGTYIHHWNLSLYEDTPELRTPL